jgi:hypothetical protein
MRGIGRGRGRGWGWVTCLCFGFVAMTPMTPIARAGWAFDTIPSATPVEPPTNALATATYTFEIPTFAAGSTTPMLNRAPNSGVAGFLASFTSSPTVAGIMVNNFQPNPLLQAQSLFDQDFPGDTLTIVFNQPVASLSFVFATDTSQGDGRLNLTSTSGSVSQNSANVGGSFPGGTFNFAPANPFTSMTLSAFNNANTQTPFAIDNLTLNIVPEPASLALVVMGLAALRRRPIRRN